MIILDDRMLIRYMITCEADQGHWRVCDETMN